MPTATRSGRRHGRRPRVDAVDANGNEIRGDGTVDDNGVDAVDANGNEIRGDGTVDDNGVDAVDASGNEIRATARPTIAARP